MTMRMRKLVGTLFLLVFVIVYALVAMALAQGRITETAPWVQTIAYMLLGLLWVLPAAFVIRWMERPDKAP
ncbi:MAG: DUF2842 domain-containing protein [Labrys sp. (in: a-proteobacteria)]|jgi:hypothetical protein